MQSYAYDGANRLTNVTSPAGAFGYQYHGGLSVGVAQVPPASPLVQKLVLPNGAYVTNVYEQALGRWTETKLMNSSGALLNYHGYTYNELNQRSQQGRLNSSVDYGYDDFGQLISAAGKEPGGTTNRWQERFKYAYDLAGNLTNRTQNVLTQTFAVNNLNQLTGGGRAGKLTVAGATTRAATSVTVNSATAIRYADNTFSSTNHTLADGNNSFTAIAQDSLGRSDTQTITSYLPASPSFGYDLNGNMTFDGLNGLEFDDENQLILITRTNAWKSEFTYDGKMRRRVRKEYTWRAGLWVLTNEVRYVYDGNLVLQERNGNKIGLVAYTRGKDLSGSLEGAGGIGGLLARTDLAALGIQPSAAHAYYSADGNGNITALINTNQAAVASYLYDPFGKTLLASGPLAEENVYRFSSMLLHSQSGDVMYPHRQYDPALQRWTSRDGLGDLGLIILRGDTARLENPILLEVAQGNLYGFVRNNPAGQVDPLGLQTANTEDWYDPLQALCEFSKAYQAMRDANTIGADKYYHCMAHCEAMKKGAKKSALAFGLGREIFDNLKHLCSRDISPVQQIKDSAKDIAANAKGLSCPPQMNCKQRCAQYLVPGLKP